MIELTAVVLTYNEEDNLRRTLQALLWVPTVLVVDSFSTDGTLEIARSFFNVQIKPRAFDTHSNQWNAGLDLVETEWVLTLDADYVLLPELQEEIQKISPSPNCDGYMAAFDYCVFGRPIRTSIYPPRVVLFRTKRARYIDQGHTQQLRATGELAQLKGHIWHDDRKPLSRWIQSQDRYTRIEAEYLFKTPEDNLNRADKIRKWIFVAPLIMPIYLLLARRLILDGWTGWYYVSQRTIVEMLLSLRLLEKSLGDGE